MTYNDAMRQKLKSNIFVVSFILLITLIFTGIKVVEITSSDLLLEQSHLLLKDYLPFIFTSYGLLALIVSILTYFYFDSFMPKSQVRLFNFFGVMFLPFTIILFVIGIMKYMEKETFKASFFASIVLGLIALGIVMYGLIKPLSTIEPVYINEYVVSGEYIIDDENSVLITATGVARGNNLLQITFEATINRDAPNLDLVGTEFIQISMNTKQTCIIYAYTEAQEDYTMTCSITTFNPDLNRDYTLNDFINFEDFYIEMGNVDYDHILNTDYSGAMTIKDQYTNENVYTKYSDLEESLEE
jgi:hypothetical protein